MPGLESFVRINQPGTGSKMKTWQSVDGGGNTVESEAVTITESGGLEVFLRATVGTVTTVLVGAVVTTLLVANPARTGCMIYNDSASRLYLKLAAGASLATFTVRIDSQGYYELPFPVYSGVITAIRAAGPATSVQVTELT
jgi:hypothetical protein